MMKGAVNPIKNKNIKNMTKTSRVKPKKKSKKKLGFWYRLKNKLFPRKRKRKKSNP